MIIRAVRVPGAVRRSYHRGTVAIIVPSFTDDFSSLTPFIPPSMIVNTDALYDADLGVATGIGASGGPAGWDTGYLADDGTWEMSPLSRFTGAT